MSAPDFAEYSEIFGVRECVLENLYEDFCAEAEVSDFEIDFFAYLVEEFANFAYLEAAINGENAVDCLEAYDRVYTALTEEV